MIGGITSSFGFGGDYAALQPFGLGGLHTQESASAFAGEVARRAVAGAAIEAGTVSGAGVTGGEASGTGNRASSGKGGTAGDEARRKGLADALEGSVRHIADVHGDAAGTAFMGLVMKRLGEGEVTEQSLGDGLLDGLRFIDRQFGTDAGDRLIDHLNGDLNDSLNGFFGNGREERFLATTTIAGGTGSTAVFGAGLTASSDTAGADGGVDLLRAMLDDLKKMRTQKGGTGLADGAASQAGAAAATDGIVAGGDSLAAARGLYAAYAAPAPFPGGVLLDMTV